MTDKEFREQRARVRQLIKKWQAPLRLTGWEINIEFHRGPYKLDGVLSDNQLGSASVLWKYRRADLGFNLEAAANHSDHELEDCVVHELCHVLVNEMRQWRDADDGLDHEERVVTELAWAFLGMKGK